jgi:hypothetical protein
VAVFNNGAGEIPACDAVRPSLTTRAIITIDPKQKLRHKTQKEANTSVHWI